MKRLVYFFYRARWIGFPGALLIALLQRTPVLRVLVAGGEFAAVSPAGQLLRGLFTTAALGALHGRAGATTYVQSPEGNPVPGTVGVPLSVAFTYTGTPSPPQHFAVSGALPPGLRFEPAPQMGVVVSGTPVITGTPTQAGDFTVFIQGFGTGGSGGQVPINFSITGGTTGTAPAFTQQPASQTVTAGANVTFTAAASGTPAPTFQWRFNGAPLAGATNASLALTNVQAANAGDYTVVATNSAGQLTSSVARLTVNPTGGGGGTAPVFVTQPAPHTIPAGGTVVFHAAATGTPAPGFQWRRNGNAISGATASMLVLSGGDSSAGTYSVVATNSAGTQTSANAALTVAAGTGFGRLINLSILTALDSAAPDFTMGFVVGGANTSGTKPLLVRAVGPSLSQLGVGGPNPDPKLELFSGPTPAGQNDDWGGSSALSTAFNAVGAFAYTGPASKDAAIFTDIAGGVNSSVKVSGVNGASGLVIAELYDSTPKDSFTPATRRLVNVSVLKPIAAGDSMTAGFVIDGPTSRTVLVRAVGPTLGAPPFGLGGVMADPQLKLFNAAQVMIAENDNWGGDAQLATAAGKVGAFALAAPTSRDAVLLLTLPPGNYTAQVSGVGTSSGSVIVEVYELP